MAKKVYEVWECYPASGRLSRPMFRGTWEECERYVDERADILPFAAGNFAILTEEEAEREFLRGEHLIIGHPEPIEGCPLCE